MSVFKCKMCGATLNIPKGTNVFKCEYCDTEQTVPIINSQEKEDLYERANYFFHNNEYDKANKIYEEISNLDPRDPESYFMQSLCKYGIEYVEDPKSKKRIPTLHRLHFESISNDINYKKAIKNADSTQKVLYENQAKYIDEVRSKILDISKKEKPYDVFICYKETDEKGQRTEDSVIAMDIYNELTKEGLKVFFSRITLEGKLGVEYEPYIFAALNSAKVMVVVGTKPEYINSPWVRNEWTRFLDRVDENKVNKKNSEKCYIVPAYKGMSPYALPNEFSSIQSQDMSKVGATQDLVHGIKKLLNKNVELIGAGETKISKKQKVIVVMALIIFVLGIALVVFNNKKRDEVLIRGTTYIASKDYETITINSVADFGEAETSQLKRIKSIKSLYFKDCVLENLDFLFELKNVNGVKFDGSTKILDFNMNNTAENIETFYYDSSSKSSEWEDISFLIRMPNLKEICIPICDGLNVLSNLKKLEIIELRSQKNTYIDNFLWCNGLDKIKVLEIKTIGDTIKFIGDDCFKGIEYLKNIEKLYLSGTIGVEKSQVLRQKDLDYISKLSTLKELKINLGGSGNAKNGYISLENLQKIKKLKSIDIYARNNFNLSGLNSLEELKEIRLAATYCDIYNSDLSCLENCNSLESLIFRINIDWHIQANNGNQIVTGYRTFDLRGIEKIKKLKTLTILTNKKDMLTILNEELAKNNMYLQYSIEERGLVN